MRRIPFVRQPETPSSRGLRSAPITASELTGAANCTVRLNHPQRMIRPNPLLKVYVAEKASTNSIIAAHRHPSPP
jgi:hypothetical protein